MTHVMTILFFLAAGGGALGIIAGMVSEYADRIATILGMPPVTALPPLRPARVRAVTRPARRTVRLRAAA